MHALHPGTSLSAENQGHKAEEGRSRGARCINGATSLQPPGTQPPINHCRCSAAVTVSSGHSLMNRERLALQLLKWHLANSRDPPRPHPFPFDLAHVRQNETGGLKNKGRDFLWSKDFSWSQIRLQWMMNSTVQFNMWVEAFSGAFTRENSLTNYDSVSLQFIDFLSLRGQL